MKSLGQFCFTLALILCGTSMVAETPLDEASLKNHIWRTEPDEAFAEALVLTRKDCGASRVFIEIDDDRHIILFHDLDAESWLHSISRLSFGNWDLELDQAVELDLSGRPFDETFYVEFLTALQLKASLQQPSGIRTQISTSGGFEVSFDQPLEGALPELAERLEEHLASPETLQVPAELPRVVRMLDSLLCEDAGDVELCLFEELLKVAAILVGRVEDVEAKAPDSELLPPLEKEVQRRYHDPVLQSSERDFLKEFEGVEPERVFSQLCEKAPEHSGKLSDE